MFKKGNQFAKLKTGKRYKTVKGTMSMIALRDLESIDDLTRTVLKNLNEFLVDPDKAFRLQTTLGCAKYLFPTRKESLNITTSIDDYIKQIESGKPLKEIFAVDPPGITPEDTTFKEIPQNTENKP